MSQENVEIVSAFIEATIRDTTEGPQSYLSADCEFNPFRHPDGPAKGPDGFTRRLEELTAQFETYLARPSRLEQVGELVVAELEREVRSKRGPAVIKDRFSQVFTLRDRKIVRVESFPTFGEALEAARLRE
ncbi:MAG TPA: nuclear transport factor 2 family protein [Thermoleophilaceae bacterium]|jgi:hypothetical protein